MLAKQVHVFLLIMLSSLTLSFAQERLPDSALQADLTILKDIAIGISPKLSEKDKMEIDSLMEVKGKLLAGQKMDVIEFLNFFSKIGWNSQFDEHARLVLAQDVLQSIFSGDNLFPLSVKIVGDRLVVNMDHPDIPYGCIIHAINGEPIDEVLQSLSQELDTYSKREVLEPQFPILFRIKKGGFEQFDISYAIPALPDLRREQSLPGIGISEWMQQRNEKAIYPLHRKRLNALNYTQHFPDHKAYYLQLNSFTWNDELEGDYSID